MMLKLMDCVFSDEGMAIEKLHMSDRSNDVVCHAQSEQHCFLFHLMIAFWGMP
jgi:hypothetical protein